MGDKKPIDKPTDRQRRWLHEGLQINNGASTPGITDVVELLKPQRLVVLNSSLSYAVGIEGAIELKHGRRKGLVAPFVTNAKHLMWHHDKQ